MEPEKPLRVYYSLILIKSREVMQFILNRTYAETLYVASETVAQ